MKGFSKGFWNEYLIQGLFWLIAVTLHGLFFFRHFHQEYRVLFTIQLICNYSLFILFFNLYYYLLVPKVLRKHWKYFLLISILLLSVIPTAKYFLDVWLGNVFGLGKTLFYGKGVDAPLHVFLRIVIYGFWALMATFLRLLLDWFRDERLKMELHNQRLKSELAFLRSQINPHFLFNTLNNIYALAYKRSEHTPEAVMKLSNMMRYMLYEANEERVPLVKEIENLQSFIELQKFRRKENDWVDFGVSGETEDKEIAPLLLMPLVENAFKHSSKHSQVLIHLASKPNSIEFKVSNTYKLHEQKDKLGGVGLTNIQRRLNLLYPQKHQIEINKEKDQFHVHLKILI
ncbi:sensor histidine kinase [Xanthovirga aplysinae]|uniref:sensor histidine kinase n=1 Tax=Xanthovirga aplysinae TaxID=2529853 RepID=UPI0012BC7B96|nr:histidine kinase [Xanthovirga aplysinae]MTI33509.1 histidine kinase [Xanthovirga aplysinae]